MGSCIFARGQTADTFLYVGGLVYRLSRVPGLHGLVEVFPPIDGAWEGARLQHCVRCNDNKGRVCDGIFPCYLLRFLLGGPKSVDVLKDAIAVDVVFLHFILHIRDVDRVQSTSDGLEVDEGLFGRYRCEESLFILQFQHPCLVDSMEDEGLCFELCLNKNIIILSASPPGYFLFSDYGSFVVVWDAWNLDHWPCRDGESNTTVGRHILGRRPNESH